VVYGAGEASIPVEVPVKLLYKLLRSGQGENVLITLNIKNGDTASEKVLIRDIQRDPVKENIIHVDFQHISLTKKITLKIAIHLQGTPTGVKDQGGILQHILREIEISCLPTEIPERVDLDVSALRIGDALRVADIVIPNVEILSDPEQAVTSVVPPTKEEEVKPAAEKAVVAEAAEGAEPEVITEKKAEERATEREKEKAGKEKEEGEKEKGQKEKK
jgi:large subunit ribosomal protein L25